MSTMHVSRRIGVVTVTFQSANVISGFLDFILSQTHSDFELFVIDNASTDSTVELVARVGDRRVRLIENTTNCGIAAANNHGIDKARECGCELVLLINNDTVFGPDLLAGLATAIEDYRCDAVVPKILCFDPPGRIWFAGGAFEPRRAWANVHRGAGKPDTGEYDTPQRVDFAPMCCMLARIELFDAVGNLDDRYFVYFEDTDFCFRAMKHSAKIWYVPAAVIRHKVSSLTGGDKSTFGVHFMVRNRVLFIRKNLSGLSRLACLVYCQALIWFRLIALKDNAGVFSLRQRSFLEGLRIPLGLGKEH